MNSVDFYTDYRHFLRDWHADRKKRFPFFSYRYFCRKAGIASPSLFREVMDGKRNLTATTLRRFINGLGLKADDGKYFESLVLFNQAKDPALKQRHLEQMRGLKPRIRQQVVPIDHYGYYSRWYNPVIRELVCTTEWHDDYGALAKLVRPAIKKGQARESVDLLLRLGFIARSAGGGYVQREPAITTGTEVVSVAVRELNRQMAGLGVDAIGRVPPQKRDVSNMVVGISQQGFQLIKQEIQMFKNRVIRIVDEDRASDTVYALNVQLFPVSAGSGDDGVRPAPHTAEEADNV